MYTVRFLSEKYCQKHNISISSKTLRCNNVRFWSKQRCQEGNAVATFLQRCRTSRPNNNQNQRCHNVVCQLGEKQTDLFENSVLTDGKFKLIVLCLVRFSWLSKLKYSAKFSHHFPSINLRTSIQTCLFSIEHVRWRFW